jgi:hypothetical protein
LKIVYPPLWICARKIKIAPAFKKSQKNNKICTCIMKSFILHGNVLFVRLTEILEKKYVHVPFSLYILHMHCISLAYLSLASQVTQFVPQNEIAIIATL